MAWCQSNWKEGKKKRRACKNTRQSSNETRQESDGGKSHKERTPLIEKWRRTKIVQQSPDYFTSRRRRVPADGKKKAGKYTSLRSAGAMQSEKGGVLVSSAVRLWSSNGEGAAKMGAPTPRMRRRWGECGGGGWVSSSVVGSWKRAWAVSPLLEQALQENVEARLYQGGMEK
jgi:hypothetical protein